MDRRKIRKPLAILGKLALVALLAWGLHSTLTSALAELSKHSWSVQPLWLVLAGLFYLAGLVAAAIFWHWILLGAHQHVTLKNTIRAFLISQLGKYVPGKAMVIVLRAGMLRNKRVDTGAVVASVFFETLSTMAAGALLSVLILLVWFRDLTVTLNAGADSAVQIKLLVAAAAMLAVTALPSIPPVFRRLVRLIGGAKLSPAGAAKVGDMRYSVLALGWLLVGFGWVLQGLSLWATMRALGAPAGGLLQNLPLHTAAVSLAVVAGFLSFIPGGLGVRELVLMPLLAPLYGPGLALVSAIVMRLAWLVAEVLVSSILYVLGPQRLPEHGAMQAAGGEIPSA